MTLQTEDRIEINDLYSKYVYAFDRNDGDAWADVFTEDGVFVRPGEKDLVGRAELSAFVGERNEANPGVKHFVTNILVEAEGDGARGRAYILAIRLDPPDVTMALRAVGYYDDELTRGPEGWRIARRLFESWLPPEVSGSSFMLSPPPGE